MRAILLTSTFRRHQFVANALASCCDLEPGNDRMRETSGDLYEAWKSFAKQAGEKPESQKAFVTNLEKRVERYRDKRGRGFRGIRLKRSEGDG